jgi:hypothetical protein
VRPWHCAERAHAGAKSGFERIHDFAHEGHHKPTRWGAMPLYAFYWFGGKDFTVYGDFGAVRLNLSWRRSIFFTTAEPPVTGWWSRFFHCRKNTSHEH